METIQGVAGECKITGYSEFLTDGIDAVPTDRPFRLQELARLSPITEDYYLSGAIHVVIPPELMRALNVAIPAKRDEMKAEILEQAVTAFQKMLKLWSEMSL